LVDALGNPLHVHLTAGNVNDVSEADKLIELAQGENFIADKAYDADHVIQAVEKKHMRPVIPSIASRKTQREIDRHLYKERHLVENFFCKIKRYRRVATRYEKTAVNFLGFVLFASIRVWLA
jgi:transposase